jgi:methionyl-tRNA synthetase
MRMAQLGNQYMNAMEPWRLAKDDQHRCQQVMRTCLAIVQALASASAPYMPTTADRIWRMLGYAESVHEHPWGGWQNLAEQNLEKPEPLFEKITMPVEASPFSKLDLRVARVERVEDHPDADRLYVLTLSLGKCGVRKIVAGIKPWYEKSDIEAKKIVIVANLQPARIRGVESNGMLLAADTGDAAVILTAQAGEGSVVFLSEISPEPVAEIPYDEFSSLRMTVFKGHVRYGDHTLRDENGPITLDRPVEDGCPIR